MTHHQRSAALVIVIALLALLPAAASAAGVTFTAPAAGVSQRATGTFTFSWTLAGGTQVDNTTTHPAVLRLTHGATNHDIKLTKTMTETTQTLSFAGTANAAELGALSGVAGTSGMVADDQVFGEAVTWTATLTVYDNVGQVSATGTSPSFEVWTQCSVGQYSGDGWGPGCVPAEPGYYVALPGQTSQASCLPGTFTADLGGFACHDAPPGTYIDHPTASGAVPCAPGTYQPRFGQVRCVDAPPGAFVDTFGATEFTPCPSGTTSPVASTTAAACVATAPPAATDERAAPAVAATTTACVVAHRAIITANCVARQLGVSISRPADLRVGLARGIQKACRVRAHRIRGVAAGSCRVVLTVRPQGGRTKTYRATVTISA